jgi:uncharacterized protein (TIGR02145 family)
MTFWEGEIKELDKLYESFKGHLPDIVKELEQLIRTEDPNVVMLYSRRCLEVIVTDLCESELQRPRKTEPLKGILDKLNSEEKVPAHIITSMQSLNSMATYGAHPKDFDPEQVKPVLNNLAIIIKWYLKYKDFKIVSKAGTEEKEQKIIDQIDQPVVKTDKPVRKRNKTLVYLGIALGIVVVIFILFSIIRVVIAFFSAQKADLTYSKYFINPAATYFTDSRDNQNYTIVKIGNQEWMGENLIATKYNDGTPIKQVKDNAKWEKNFYDSTKIPAYCWYDNKKSVYGGKYGALYNWYAVNTGKLCPIGWHVPSDAEWDTLELFLDPGIDTAYMRQHIAGIKMKEEGNSHWTILDTQYGTNESGFTALPGGNRNCYGPFFDVGTQAGWWSSTEYEHSDKDAWSREIRESDGSNNLLDFHNYKNFGFSVRCVKDE